MPDSRWLIMLSILRLERMSPSVCSMISLKLIILMLFCEAISEQLPLSLILQLSHSTDCATGRRFNFRIYIFCESLRL